MKIAGWSQLLSELTAARNRYEKLRQTFDSFYEVAKRAGDPMFPIKDFTVAPCVESAFSVLFLGRELRVAFHFDRRSENGGVIRFYDGADTRCPPVLLETIVFDELGNIVDTSGDKSPVGPLWEAGAAGNVLLTLVGRLLDHEPDLPCNCRSRPSPVAPGVTLG
jgi:hypothetical protein